MSVFYVQTLQDSPNCQSFRAGIKSGQDIVFNVTGTITLTSDLPPIDHKITITSSPDVIIDANGYNGLVITKAGSGSIITALNVINSKRNGLTLYNASNCLIELSHFLNNKNNGIYVKYGKNNKFFRVLLSSNGNNGIEFNSSEEAVLYNNYVGVEFSGASALPNLNNGIYMYKTDNSIIGGDYCTDSDITGQKGTATPVYTIPPQGNLSSGNKFCGILLEKCKNVRLHGNLLGVNFDGTSGIGNGGDGLWLKGCESIVIRGCNADQNPFAYANVASANMGNGFHITDSTNIIVQGNIAGISYHNNAILSNDKNGILIDGKSMNVQLGGVIPLGNVFSGNRLCGVYITDFAKNVISFNSFLSLFAFGLSAPNILDGLRVDTQNKDPDHFVLCRTSVHSGSRGHGLSCINTQNVVIDSVIFGLSTSGEGFLPNRKSNLYISNSNNVIVISQAKSVIFTSNVLGGSAESGIVLTNGSYNCRIESAFIGVDILGVSAFSNLKAGILIEKGSHDNVVNTNIDSSKNKELTDKINSVIDEINAANPSTDTSPGLTNIPISDTVRSDLSAVIELLPNIIAANDKVGVYMDETTYNNAIVNNYIGYNIKREPLPNYVAEIIDKSGRNVVKNNLIYTHKQG
jgi:hypothetical protein